MSLADLQLLGAANCIRFRAASLADGVTAWECNDLNYNKAQAAVIVEDLQPILLKVDIKKVVLLGSKVAAIDIDDDGAPAFLHSLSFDVSWEARDLALASLAHIAMQLQKEKASASSASTRTLRPRQAHVEPLSINSSTSAAVEASETIPTVLADLRILCRLCHCLPLAVRDTARHILSRNIRVSDRTKLRDEITPIVVSQLREIYWSPAEASVSISIINQYCGPDNQSPGNISLLTASWSELLNAKVTDESAVKQSVQALSEKAACLLGTSEVNEVNSAILAVAALNPVCAGDSVVSCPRIALYLADVLTNGGSAILTFGSTDTKDVPNEKADLIRLCLCILRTRAALFECEELRSFQCWMRVTPHGGFLDRMKPLYKALSDTISSVCSKSLPPYELPLDLGRMLRDCILHTTSPLSLELLELLSNLCVLWGASTGVTGVESACRQWCRCARGIRSRELDIPRDRLPLWASQAWVVLLDQCVLPLLRRLNESVSENVLATEGMDLDDIIVQIVSCRLGGFRLAEALVEPFDAEDEDSSGEKRVAQSLLSVGSLLSNVASGQVRMSLRYVIAFAFLTQSINISCERSSEVEKSLTL